MSTILLENVHGLTLKNDMRLEHIIAQLQPLLHKEIVCVKNGTSIVIYRNKSEFPNGLKLEAVVDDIYYIRSVLDNDLYSIAGKEIATILFPNIASGGIRYSSINNMGTVTSEIINRDNRANIKKVSLDIHN